MKVNVNNPNPVTDEPCPECDGVGCEYCYGDGTCDSWLSRERGEGEGYKNICSNCKLPSCNNKNDECLIVICKQETADHQLEVSQLHG